MERQIQEIARTLDAARKVKDDDGISYLERRGWTLGELSPLAEQLRGLADQLIGLGTRADASPELPPAEQMEILDEAEQAA